MALLKSLVSSRFAASISRSRPSLNTSKTTKIAVIGGDGTGPEVTVEALKVLAAVAKLEKFSYELTHFDFGGERYMRTGETLPAGAVDELRKFDAIFLGAVGHP